VRHVGVAAERVIGIGLAMLELGEATVGVVTAGRGYGDDLRMDALGDMRPRDDIAQR
jgi:hypothetical protein